MTAAAIIWIVLTGWIALVVGVASIVLILRDRLEDIFGLVVGAIGLVWLLAAVLGAGDR